MAAAVVAPGAIDLHIQGNFPVRLGTSISESSRSDRWTALRYNHKPKVKPGKNVRVNISAAKSGSSKLEWRDDDGECTYTGKSVDEEDTYVLLCKGEGKDREMLLERVDSIHDFNLTGMHEEQDASALSKRYPHLPEPAGDDGEGDLFGGDDDTKAPSDLSNPFDWRHFLKAELEKPESASASTDTSRGPASNSHNESITRSTPAARPAAKRKAPVAATKKPNPKRVKAGPEPPTVTAPPTSKSKTEASHATSKPTASRKPPAQQPSDDESFDFVVEDDEPVKPKGSMALALGGLLGSGPVSLQSFGNSPASQGAANAAASPEPEYSFDFGDDDEQSPGHAAESPGELMVVEDDDNDADADVEDLELPSPAQRPRHSISTATIAGEAPAEGDEDAFDDDMEAMLAAALNDDDDESADEEEPVSEEE